MVYGMMLFAGFLIGPVVVFIAASNFGAPWWAALIIAMMFGGLATIIINLTGMLILKLFGIDERTP
jgi:hypothetical protein